MHGINHDPMFCQDVILIHSLPCSTLVFPFTTPLITCYVHLEVEISHLEISLGLSTEEENTDMVLLDHLWDDIVAGPQPERGLKHLKRVDFTTPLNVKENGGKLPGSLSMPGTPVTPGTPTVLSPNAVKKENVWRSVFNPGSNLATKGIGSNIFDKPQPNSPTVYDWMYSGETRSKHR